MMNRIRRSRELTKEAKIKENKRDDYRTTLNSGGGQLGVVVWIRELKMTRYIKLTIIYEVNVNGLRNMLQTILFSAQRNTIPTTARQLRKRPHLLSYAGCLLKAYLACLALPLTFLALLPMTDSPGFWQFLHCSSIDEDRKIRDEYSNENQLQPSSPSVRLLGCLDICALVFLNAYHVLGCVCAGLCMFVSVLMPSVCMTMSMSVCLFVCLYICPQSVCLTYRDI